MSNARKTPLVAWAIAIAVSAVACLLLIWIIYIKDQPDGGKESLLFLPGLNAILNAASAFCLVRGFMEIKRGRVRKHMRWMFSAFGCSTIFLISYVLHHYLHGDSQFPQDNGLRPIYLTVLATHIVTSIVALPLILMTFYAALTAKLTLHKRLAKFTFPMWMYVSVTGVVVYLFLKSAGI